MKVFLFLLMLVFFAGALQAQTDTLPPYQQVPYVPPFKILQADSSWFTKKDLQAKKPVLILYFSPDCGHCQLETEEIISRIKELSNLQIVMITSRDYNEMKDFYRHYMLQKFPTIRVGSDTTRFISRFYNVKFTPFSALYNKKGQLVKVWEQGANLDELARLSQ